MNKINLIILALLLASMGVHAQKVKELSFSETTYDFGSVQEDDGPIEHEFMFTNNSAKEITITNVKASCGCTTPGWSKEPVLPGETGYIKAKYNPKNRPGPFNKNLTVTTNAEESTLKLYIKGNVKPGAKSAEEKLTTKMGGLRVEFKTLNVGKVLSNEEAAVKRFDIYNASDKPVTFKDEVKAPSHIKAEVLPKVIKPKETASIVLTYNAKAKNDLGFMNENITLYTDEATDAEKSFSVYATIDEYFPPMTPEELAKAPRLSLKNTVHDFGKIKQGDVVSTQFTIINTGKTPLSIRKAVTNCSCTISKVEKSTIKPGKSGNIKVTFDSEGRRGNQQKSVTIYSNDPKNPIKRVTVKAVIETVAQ